MEEVFIEHFPMDGERALDWPISLFAVRAERSNTRRTPMKPAGTEIYLLPNNRVSVTCCNGAYRKYRLFN